VSQGSRLTFRTKYDRIDLKDMEAKHKKRQELLAKSEHWFLASTISGSTPAESSGSPMSHGLPFSQAPTGSTCDQTAYDALFARSPSTGTQSSSSGIDPLSPASDVGTLLSETTRTHRGDGMSDLDVEPELYPDGLCCDASRDLSTVHQASQAQTTLDHFPSLSPDSSFADYVHVGGETSATDPAFDSPNFDFGWSRRSTAVRDDEIVGGDYSTRRRETDGHSMVASSDADPPFDLGEFVNTACFDDV
jgi:hypothetical protein